MNTSLCRNCGESRNVNERFCADCGYEFGSLRSERHSKPGMTKRTKIMFGSVAFLLFVLVSVHFYIKSIISPEEQIAAIEEALQKGDAKQLIEAINIADDVIYDPHVYLDSLQYENPAFLMEEIIAAVQRTKEVGIPQIITSQHIGDIFKVEQERFFGIYKRIYIAALDYEVKLKTDLPSGKLAIGEESWEFDGKSMSLGRFLPGTYVAVLSNDSLAEGSVEEEIFVQSNDRINVYRFNKEKYMISFLGGSEDGFLVVNGKETDEKISDLQEAGPFFTREIVELRLAREIDGKSQYSEIVHAYPGEIVNFSVFMQAE